MNNSVIKEITLGGVLLGIFLAILISIMNTYLALKVGMSISAGYFCAIVISSILRPIRPEVNVREENITRIIATAGEVLACSIVFVIPALFILDIWTEINYVATVVMCTVGGVFGILISYLLQNILFDEAKLPFPEAHAIASLTQVEKKKKVYRVLLPGISLGVLLAIIKDGFGMVRETIECVRRPFYLSTPSTDAMVLCLGYIIGIGSSLTLFSGSILSWFVILPLMSMWEHSTNILQTFTSSVQPIALGCMTMGIIWILYQFGKEMLPKSIRAGRKESKLKKKSIAFLLAFALFLIPLFFFLTHDILTTLILTLIVFLLALFLTVSSGYACGLIGSSANPLSAMTFIALLVMGGVFTLLHWNLEKEALLLITAMVASILALSGDLIQEFKITQILGGNRRKAVIGELIGVAVSAPFIAFTIESLHRASKMAGGTGIGGVDLPVPPANLMAMFTDGLVGGGAPWLLIGVGALIGIALILAGVSSPLLVGIGMFLPLHLPLAILLGGIARWIADRKSGGKNKDIGITLAACVIAGQSLAVLGIVTARIGGFDLPKLGPFDLLVLLPLVLTFFVLTYLPIRLSSGK